MMGFGGLGVMGGFGMLFGLLVWVALIGLLIWGASALFAQRGSVGAERPLDILQRRYARGEVTEAEFEQAKRVLA